MKHSTLFIKIGLCANYILTIGLFNNLTHKLFYCPLTTYGTAAWYHFSFTMLSPLYYVMFPDSFFEFNSNAHLAPPGNNSSPLPLNSSFNNETNHYTTNCFNCRRTKSCYWSRNKFTGHLYCNACYKQTDKRTGICTRSPFLSYIKETGKEKPLRKRKRAQRTNLQLNRDFFNNIQ